MRAPQPEPPIPGSFATPSLLAWIVNGKYVMSLPLYRIETDLKACGATISRQDMANWMMNVHARWLAKVHERMKVELLSHVRIHADETTVQVVLLQCLFDRFGSVFPQCGLMVFPGVVIVSR